MARPSALRNVALLLAVLPAALAGCGSPEEDPPAAAPPVREVRVEAESFLAAEPTCGAGADALVGLLYAAWASDGLVARLPVPGCALRLEAALPAEARLRGVRVLAESVPVGAEARVEVAVDGNPAGAVTWRPLADAAQDLAFDSAARQAEGPHDVRILFDVAGGPRDWALQVDYLVFEAPLPLEADATPAAGGATASPSNDTAVGLAGPLRVEAESFDYVVPGCSTADQRAESRRADWASNGWSVLLPRGGCGLVFEDFDLSASGRFTRFAAQFAVDGPGVEARLRVSVDGETVSQRTVDQRTTQAPFDGAFDTLMQVEAGRHEVRIDYEVLAGPADTDLLLDYVEFRAGA